MLNLTKTKMQLARSAIALLTLSSAPALADGGRMPPYENLVAAKQYVQSVSARVQELILRCQGGGSGGDGGWGEGRPGHGGWGEGRPGHGGWGEGRPGHGGHGPRIPSGPHRFASIEADLLESDAELDAAADESAEGDVLENDNLANLALQVMGRKLFDLGQTIDQATMNYGTPAFWGYWTHACTKTSALITANQGAKVSASLPVQGLVTPADFAPNDAELYAVKQQLWCP